MQIWTVNEQDCYDAGFEAAKDYFIPLERERIVDYLNREYSNPLISKDDIIKWLMEEENNDPRRD